MYPGLRQGRVPYIRGYLVSRGPGYGGPFHLAIIVGMGLPIFPARATGGVGFQKWALGAVWVGSESQIETPPPPDQSPQARQANDLKWANEPLRQGIASGWWWYRVRLALENKGYGGHSHSYQWPDECMICI